MEKLPKFKNYKEEQQYYAKISRRGKIIYDPCKIVRSDDSVIRKGVPLKYKKQD